jgi:hypothetical protein
MMDDHLEPGCAPSQSAGDRLTERLGENTAPTAWFSAAEAANRDAHLNGATIRGQIQEPPLIPAVHLLGGPPAIGTADNDGATSGSDDEAIHGDLDVVDQQTGRQQ